MSTWLIVADNSTARIFTMETRSSPINEIETIVHTEARLHEQDMTSDLPGKGGGKAGASQHAYQSEVSPKDQENLNFAKQVANELDEARKANKFTQFALVASPGFLGNLRNQLSPQTKKVICYELDKNLVHLKAKELRGHLPDTIPGLS